MSTVKSQLFKITMKLCSLKEKVYITQHQIIIHGFLPKGIEKSIFVIEHKMLITAKER